MTISLNKEEFNMILSWIDNEQGWEGWDGRSSEEAEEDRAIHTEIMQRVNGLRHKLQMAELRESLKKDTRAMNRIKID